jgi:phosphonate transport system substrate-binding protein
MFRKIRLLLLVSSIACTGQINGQTGTPTDIPLYKVIIANNLFSEVDLNDARAAMKVWVRELTGTIKPEFRLQTVFVNDIGNLNASSLKNAALICVNSIDYLDYKAKLNLEGAFVPLRNDNVFSTYILLTNNNVENIRELKNRNMGIGRENNHLIASMWLNDLLNNYNLPPADQFFRIKESDKESQIILSLFFKQLDACVVTRNAYNLMVELNPQIGKRLKIIAVSPKIVLTVTSFSKNFKSIKHRKKIIESAERLSSYINGKQILTLMNIDKVVPFKKEYLNNLKTILSEYKKILTDKKRR